MKTTCVDRGGTFTDVVIFRDTGPPEVRKVPSDRAVVGELAVGDLRFGTTVATNALLERTGVRVLLLTTAGLGDLAALGDMTRPALFDPDAGRPPPLLHRVQQVTERMAADGTVAEPMQVPTRFQVAEVQAVAVVLRHSVANPAHERALAEAVRAAHPDLYVTMSHQVDPEVGLLPRLHTTLVDASITPVLRRAIGADRIADQALAMRSDGSLVPASELRAPAAVLSGPAGGVLAVAEVARQAGFSRAVGLDMGGTSTDVCRVDGDHLPLRTGHVEVAGVQLRTPMLEVHTIAAGGGSILTSDGLELRVGPESAGADPGPQCYGRGGPPTLTDAALAAGLVQANAFDPPLDSTAVSLPAPAEAFLEVAREAMAAAVRRLATERGVDLRDHALVAYGGAAGQHAAAVADKLHIGTVLVHPCAAVLSAWGQRLARPAHRVQEPAWRPLEHTWPDLTAIVERLERRLPPLPHRRFSLLLRAIGTDHPLEISWEPDSELDEIRGAFEREHLRVFGFQRRESTLELVAVKAVAQAPAPTAPPRSPDPFGVPDEGLSGPNVVHSATTTVAIPAGWTARFQDGLLRLTRRDPPPTPAATVRSPLGVALWSHRFMSVAEQAGETLRRLARSVNIRERRDFSCAVFDEGGHLVANAPHIPVHLGAMGETVRDLLAHEPRPADGQSWLTNDPAAGGSHLPDLTVITAVHHGERCFFVACRGHHVDVGGLTPGSMPPASTRLDEEGVVLRRLPLLHDGHLRTDLPDLLAGCRDVPTVIADLEAQLAANRHGARTLRALASPGLLSTWMAHLQDVADEAVATLLPSLPVGRAEDEIDGVPLRLNLRRQRDRLVVDFSGTRGPHSGNLNAPRAVVRAATLYALRVMVDRPIPLNEGALRAVDIGTPTGSLLDPPPGSAVAGGNVETSQRLVDLLLLAAGRRAASAGSMSNLTLGGDRWSFYETLAGGLGATPRRPGPSATQAHMTNTAATDPEVLERRLPLVLRRFERRAGSGGTGLHPGGDGLVREIEVLAPAQVALLAAWRPDGAAGLQHGGRGAPGEAHLFRGGTWQPWDGSSQVLEPNDRVRIRTPGGGGYSPGLSGVQG